MRWFTVLALISVVIMSFNAVACGEDEVPLGDAKLLDPARLANHTLSASYAVSGLSGQPSQYRRLNVEQAATDNYHSRTEIKPGVRYLETWLVDGVSYIWEDDEEHVDSDPNPPTGKGEVHVLLSTGSATLTTPMELQQSLPTPAAVAAAGARKIGTESINGRKATRYHLEGAAYLRIVAQQIVSATGRPLEFRDMSGGYDLWIDNVLEIPIRAEATIDWSNLDGSTGQLRFQFNVTLIGSTPLVTDPREQSYIVPDTQRWVLSAAWTVTYPSQERM